MLLEKVLALEHLLAQRLHTFHRYHRILLGFIPGAPYRLRLTVALHEGTYCVAFIYHRIPKRVKKIFDHNNFLHFCIS